MTDHRTELERLLAEALEAKAAAITPADLRPAAPPSGPRRAAWPRLRWTVLAPAAALAAAALVGWLILVTWQPRPHPVQPATPPPRTPSTPSPSPLAPTPTPTTSRVHIWWTELTGTGDRAYNVITDGAGYDAPQRSLALPWKSRSVTGDTLSISIKATPAQGQVLTCKIVYDYKVVATATSKPGAPVECRKDNLG